MSTTDAAPAHLASASRARPPRRRRPRSVSAAYWPYLLPGLISFVVVILVPFLLNIWYSFHSWKGGLSPKRWIGLDNYSALLADDAFWLSFRNSLSMIAAMVVVPTLLGLLLAAVLDRKSVV